MNQSVNEVRENRCESRLQAFYKPKNEERRKRIYVF